MSKEDTLLRLKFMGYCLAHLPPKNVPGDFSDFVAFAQFQLAQEFGVLTKDPVWDRYTDEEILIEYFGLLFTKNDDAKTEFEGVLYGKSSDDDISWIQQQLEESESMEDEVSFRPEDLNEAN